MSGAAAVALPASSSSSDERPPASLPLPNRLAYAIAGFSVVSALLLLSAIATSGASWLDALSNHDLHNIDLAAVLGAVILRRSPGHAIGWLLVTAGAFEAVTVLSRAYYFFGLPDGLAVDLHLAGFWVPGVAALVIGLPQLFPDGRLLSRRWFPLACYGMAATTLLFIVFLAVVSEDAVDSSGWFTVAFPLFGVAALCSLIPLAVRFRRSRGEQRQQFKWVFYGLAIALPMLALGSATVLIGDSPANAALTLAALEIIPAAVTVAVLRYRLYDVDVVISRTLLVAGLVSFITAAYVGIVVGVGSLLGGGGNPNVVLSVVATTVVAVAFQPVRRWLQRVANRLVFGRRSTPYDVLSGFATRVGAGESSPESLVHVAELLAGGTGADPARVWLRVGSTLRAEATWPPSAVASGMVTIDVGGDLTIAVGQLPQADLAVPVVERGELLGVLTIAKPRGERVSEVDTDLVERLAAASGVVLRNLRLDAELGQRLVDLEASRRRLVSAQDDARRRIEADLAGGSRAELLHVRDRLMALVATVDADAAPKTAMLLTQLVEATNGALGTLAGLAAGVYPPRLAADGLVAALTEQAAKAALPVQVRADGVGRYEPDVEAAAYFAVLEGLQNVAKYADATTAQVRLRGDVDWLRFEVVDDGIGFDTATTTMGSGLQGITDRLDTVGGSLTITSRLGAGTTVTGHIPAPVAAAPVPELVGVVP